MANDLIRALALVVTCAVLAGPGCRAGGGPVGAVDTPEVRGAPVLAAEKPRPDESSDESSDERSRIRIGEFERPEGVPEYEILDERRRQRDGARAASLFVDTRSDSQEEYVLITRDIKARYADLDAVSVEFVDLSRTLRYSGGALIFNTAAGADYIGYIYGPPNNKGYYVSAAD